MTGITICDCLNLPANWVNSTLFVTLWPWHKNLWPLSPQCCVTLMTVMKSHQDPVTRPQWAISLFPLQTFSATLYSIELIYTFVGMWRRLWISLMEGTISLDMILPSHLAVFTHWISLYLCSMFCRCSLVRLQFANLDHWHALLHDVSQLLWVVHFGARD